MSIFKKAYDIWKKYTLAGIAYTKVDEAAQFHVYIANNSGQPISVVVSANPDWAFVDLAAAVLTLFVSAGSSAPAGLQALQSSKTLYEIYNATRIWRGIGGVASKLWNIFSETGTVIHPGNLECVNKKSKSNPFNYLTPSQWAAVTGKYTGGKDLEILIVREDGLSALIKSNSDESWIANSNDVRRSERGKVWVPVGDGFEWGSPIADDSIEDMVSDSMKHIGEGEWRDGP